MATVQQLTNYLPNAKVLWVDPDLVSISDIAARIGFTREAVRQWTNATRKPFPDEYSFLDSGQKVWKWVVVAEWLHRIKNIDMDEDLPTPDEVREIDILLAQIPKRMENAWTSLDTSHREFISPGHRGPHDSSRKSEIKFTSLPGESFREMSPAAHARDEKEKHHVG